MIGGNGNDALTGRAGNDLFIFDTSLNASTNVDNLIDFSVSDDTIQLENLIFSKLTAVETLNADLFYVESVGAQGANDYIVYNAATGALTYDSYGNGAGVGTLFATVAANLGLTTEDFVVS